MAPRVKCMAMICSLVCTGVAAEQMPATDLPEPALLEFLGEWQDDEGKDIDWEMLDTTTVAEPVAAPVAGTRDEQ